MSFLWSLLDGGISMARADTIGRKIAMWVGRRLALRHRFVTIPRSCRVHPEARIHPRNGSIVFGENCEVAHNAIVQGNVRLGDNCSIQTGAILVGYGTRDNPDGMIRIGNGVRIAPMVMMYGGDHVFEPGRPIHGQGLKNSPIVIEDDVWIAGRVNVAAGVTIGRGSVIGGGAVVTNDIPADSVAVGVPAKVIKSRDPSAG